MENRTDKRLSQTRKKIRKALLELVKEKNIRDITVEEICKKAEINPRSFATYYSDPITIMDDISNDYIEVIKNALNETDLYTKENTSEDKFTIIFKFLLDHKDTAGPILNNVMTPVFVTQILSMAKANEFFQLAMLDFSEPLDNEEYRVNKIIYQAIRLLKNWISEPEPYDPRQLARKVLNEINELCLI